MWVYGDAEHETSPLLLLARIEALLADMSRLPGGLERHAKLVSAFVTASELMQGVADADFAVWGLDGPSEAQDAAMGLLAALAETVVRSWQRGCRSPIPPSTAMRSLAGIELPSRIVTRRAEGYAFYGLYPEAYAAAAFASNLGPETRVIGIRSIGCGLGAIVAAALGAPPPVTVRPTGDPFHREVRTDPLLDAMVRRDAGATFAIVDEGPGLSGSSFAAIADWLEGCGVAAGRIRFFPGHGGAPGAKASVGVRARWERTRRHVRTIDELLLDTNQPMPGLPPLAHWVADLLGPLDGPVEDISGGKWRLLQGNDEEHWPAADPRLERRKWLARARGKPFLVKFAGLGEDGTRKLDVARKLFRAGFTPEPIGLRHGFLVERWVEANALDMRTIDRPQLINRVGEYIAFRARHLAAPACGASPSSLGRMARHNIRLAFGDELAAALGMADTPDHAARHVHTDGRLQTCEWLVDAGGNLLKTDALDHAMGHDLVGCQDVTWDIAGAIAEFGLDGAERDRLCALVEKHSGATIDRPLLELMLPCYLGFQVGLWSMATEAADDAERRRIKAKLRGYRSALQRIAG